MKRIIRTIALVAVLAASVSSCNFVHVNTNLLDKIDGNGTRVAASSNYITDEYNVPDFNRMDIYLPADIKYEMTEDEPSVNIYAPDNLMEYLRFEVNNGCLMVQYSENIRANNLKDLKIRVKSSTLQEVNILGAGDFDIPSPLVCESFSVSVKGAGDVEVNSVETTGNVDILIQGAGDVDLEHVECDAVTATIQGAGDVDIAGKCNTASLTIQGAGDIDIRRLEAGDISSKVQGMGSIVRN